MPRTRIRPHTRSVVSTLALLASAALAVVPTSQASPLAGLSEIGIEYDAALGTLPDAQGWSILNDDRPPEDGLDTSNYSVSGGVLHQGPTGGFIDDVSNRQWIEASMSGYDFDSDVVIVEFRARIVRSTVELPPSSGPRAGFGLLVNDVEGSQVVFYLGEDHVFLFGTNAQTSPAVIFDTTTDFVDYRLRIDAFGASIRANGVLLTDLPRSSFGLSSAVDRLILGDITINQLSESELQFVRVGRADPAESEARELEWVTATTAFDSASPKSLIVDCPAGKRVIGGGARAEGSSLLLQDSHPTGGAPYTQWFARAEQRLVESGPWSLQVDVLCGEIPGLEIVETTAFNDYFDATATAVCPGKVAVGAGAQSSPGGSELIGLREIALPGALGTHARANGRLFEYEGVIEGISFDVTAYASCAPGRDWIVETVSTASDSSQTKSISAVCPSGLIAVGGGSRVIGAPDRSTVIASHPNAPAGPLPDRWTAVGVESGSSAEDWSLEVSVVCALPVEATVSRRSLAGRWRADDGLPTDDLGRNDGLLRNGASIEPALVDQAFRLEAASDQWVEIPGEDFYFEDSFTVEAWIQTDGPVSGDFATIASLYDIGGVSTSPSWSTWILSLTGDGRPYGFVRPGAVNLGSTMEGSVSIADGQPHHMALVRDNNPSVREHLLYVDGVLVASDPVGGGENGPLYPGDAGSPDPVSIGTQLEGGTANVIRPFDGWIDDVKLYDRARSADELRQTAGCARMLGDRVLNIDAGRFGATAGASDDHRLCVFLEPGTYTLELVNPALDPDAHFTAWRPDPSASWQTAWTVVGEVDPGLDGGRTIGEPTAQDAFDATLPRTETLEVTAPQRFYFSIESDAPVEDNDGGVSLSMTVPEPGVALSTLLGTALLGALGRRRPGRSLRVGRPGRARPASDS